MAMKTVKIGMLGCGWIANYHLGILNKIGGNMVTACCDLNSKLAEKFAAKTPNDCTIFDDPIKMVLEADVDAFFVCIPPFAHGELEKALAKRRLPAMIEKPVSYNGATARKIAKTLPDDMIISIAYNWRYMEHMPKIQKFVSKQMPLIFDASWKEHMCDARWWFDKDKSGGPLVDQASHLLDIGLYLLGPVTEVNATQRTDREPMVGDVSDTILSTFKFKSGTSGRILHTCMLSKNRHRIGFDLIFPRTEISVKRNGTTSIIDPKGTDYLQSAYDRSYENENTIFLNAVRTGKKDKIRCTYADAVKTLELADAIHKSANTGKPVKL